MATKTKTKATNGTMKGRTEPPTPGELQELIYATVMKWFPHCDHVSLILIPAPGCSPLELSVSGYITNIGHLGDTWVSELNGGHWTPVE